MIRAINTTPKAHQIEFEPGQWTGYPGSKGASGVAERIVSILAAHDVFISAYLGHCAVLRKKRPAKLDLGIDADPLVIDRWRRQGSSSVTLLQEDCLAWLRSHAAQFDERVLIYFDPPYLLESRTAGQRLYGREMFTVNQHRQFLQLATNLRCRVLVSHYEHPLYMKKLRGWHVERIVSSTRRGPRMELVFANYDPTTVALHDVRFLGNNYRERELIKKLKGRWAKRFAAMSPNRRQAVREALDEAEQRHL